MTVLLDLLRETMLLVPRNESSWWTIGRFRLGPPPAITKTGGRWQWRFALESGAPRLRDLRCYNSAASLDACGVDAHFPRVCDTIEWEPPAVTPPGACAPVPLPFRPEFVVGHYYYDGTGDHRMRIGEGGFTGRLFTMSRAVESGVQVVYGYEWDGARFVPWRPSGTTPEEVLRAEFGDQATQAPAAVVTMCGPTGPLERRVVTLTPLRVVVVAAFVGCEPAFDYDPGRAGYVARMYPLTMLVANRSLVGFTARTRVFRPNGSLMNDGEVSPAMAALLVTDRNGARPEIDWGIGTTPSLPYWDTIFDWYLPVGPEGHLNERFVAVHHTHVATSDGPVPRQHPVAMSRSYDNQRYRVQPGPALYREMTRVTKVPGQGEFDNLHLAPRMNLRLPWGRAVIAMAPFCIHDCLHMHFRWGDRLNDIPDVRGWSPEGVPNSVSGAPLVPRNQDVVVTLQGALGFQYDVEGHGVPRGAWQVVLHDGLGYALELRDSVRRQVLAGTGAVGTVHSFLHASWPAFYFILRYADFWQQRHAPTERVQANLAALREPGYRPPLFATLG